MWMFSALAYVHRVVFRLWVTRFCGTPNLPIIQTSRITALIWIIIERFGPHMPSVAGKLAGFRATPEIQYTKDCVSEPELMQPLKRPLKRTLNLLIEMLQLWGGTLNWRIKGPPLLPPSEQACVVHSVHMYVMYAWSRVRIQCCRMRWITHPPNVQLNNTWVYTLLCETYLIEHIELITKHLMHCQHGCASGYHTWQQHIHKHVW